MSLRLRLPILGQPQPAGWADGPAGLDAPVDADAEGALAFLEMPPPIAPWTAPRVDTVDEGLRAALLGLAAILERASSEAAATIVPMPTEAALRAAVVDALGEGEVRALVAGTHAYEIVETAFPGVWRVRTLDAQGAVVGDHLEVGAVPRVVHAAAIEGTTPTMPLDPAQLAAPDLMNAPALLHEIADRMAHHRPGRASHVVSFTLLPLSDGDMRLLQSALGAGPVSAESRGYGSCRVHLTARRHVWSVQYLNAMGTVILDTLEIGDVPSALTAAEEDFEDSAIRLREVVGPTDAELDA